MTAFDRSGLERIDRQLVRVAIPALAALVLLWVVLMLIEVVPVFLGLPLVLLDLLAVGGFYVAHRVVRVKITQRTAEIYRRR